jgi:hypothetical protein
MSRKIFQTTPAQKLITVEIRFLPARPRGGSFQSVYAWLAFAVTPQLLVSAILWAATIGLVDGLFPAIRAVRIPIAAALREM